MDELDMKMTDFSACLLQKRRTESFRCSVPLNVGTVKVFKVLSIFESYEFSKCVFLVFHGYVDHFCLLLI